MKPEAVIARVAQFECCAGVESSEQFSILENLGCQLDQGYYVGMPMPAIQIPKALASLTVGVAAEAAAVR